VIGTVALSALGGMFRVGLPAPVPATKHPLGPHWVTQVPEPGSHVWLGIPQVTGLPPPQTPVWQVLPVVQASPSLHAVPLATFVKPQPVLGWHTAATQGLLLPGHWTAVPLQTPEWQESLAVHALPSLQPVPSATLTITQPY